MEDETRTFEALLQSMLAQVPDDVDKREGSIVYNALAPAAAKLAQAYLEIELNRNLSYAATSSGEWLEKRTAEHGVNRKKATKAKRKGLFQDRNGAAVDVPIGSRFALDDLTYAVVEAVAPGVYELECEVAGTEGNSKFGAMLPVDYVAGLAKAELEDVRVPGEEEESDESLYQRYLAAINEQPFGGNVADYKNKICEVTGVGGVKVFPAWQGGGTVKCTILASDYTPPTSALIDDVQTFIDPIANSGQGLGFAPIGHKVTIAAAQTVNVVLSAVVTLQSGYTIGQVQPEIEEVFAAYLLSLRKRWKDTTEIIVRISQIEARILGISGIADIMGTTLNGSARNFTLGTEQVPVSGGVSVNVG